MTQQQQQPTQAELREVIREQVRKSVQDAQVQVRKAQRELEAAQHRPDVHVERVVTQNAPLAPLPPLPPMDVVVASPQQAPGPYIGVPGYPERLDDIPPRAQEMGIMAMLTMAVIIIGLPIARAIGRVIDRRWSAPQLPTADMQPQLLRIEQAVEAMAIEIERISENQRYLTKLQAGREEEAVLIPRRTRD
jgi:hypothetical protein